MFNIDTGQSKDPKVILNRFVKERISSFQRSMLVRLPRKRTLVVFLFLNAFIFEADSQITVLHLSSNSTSGVTGTWTVPTGVSKIRITAKGAKGGYGNNGGSNRTYFYGGNGATISGEFVVNAGQTLEAVAGGIGGDFQYSNGGGSGGGGSGVRIQNGSDLIIAGGGGGGGNTVAGGGSSSIGGLGNGGAGGGGLYSNGGAGGGGLNSAGGNGAAGRTGGGAGFNASGGVGSAFPGGGGYGGGGAGYFGGGGGGGYTGGAGGDAGGGGTSYNTGANQTFSGSSNNDFGDVIIEILGQAKWASTVMCRF